MRLQFDPIGKDMPYFIIPFSMPGLNEYLAECARSPQAGGKIKRENMNFACNCIRKYLKKWKATKPLIIHFYYFQKDKRMDKDNIDSFARKVIFDALQKTGTIRNDGWGEIENYTHDFFIDSKHPRIVVYLEEIEE